ncbi:hypothetical protein [Brevundimonas sp. FT23042]|uniref:hypothetical protein n=1 Tax=Brevundimonas sp. FT23042 TaxID=3393749 RepID=UPI003B585E38
MKTVRLTLALAAAVAVLAPVSVTQAQMNPYFQCVRATEISCGFPYPSDIDAYQECVAVNVPLNCGHLPGAPDGL